MDDDNSFTDMQFMCDEMEIDDVIIESVFDSSSSEEEQEQSNRSGRAPNKKRDFVSAYQQQISFYFNGRESIYSEKDFERQFRCPRSVFMRVHDALMGKHPFIHYKDATGKLGVFPLVKLVGCFRYIAYGDAVDREDENLQVGESTLDPIIKLFTRMIVDEFGGQYLNRCPTDAETASLSVLPICLPGS